MENDIYRKIAYMLRTMRTQKNLSVKEVVERLKDFGVNIAPKTIYNWETGHSLPNDGVLFALCVVYGYKDIFSIYGYKFDDESNVSELDSGIIEKFLKLSDRNKIRIEGKIDDYLEEQSTSETVNIFRAANSDDNAAPEILDVSPKRIKKLEEAEETEEI